MRVDPNLGDKVNLVTGLYSFEIINAKETTWKKEPQRNQIIVEFSTIAGPDDEQDNSTVGAEPTEFIDLCFEGMEGKGLGCMKSKLTGFVLGLDNTIEEFRAKDVRDLHV